MELNRLARLVIQEEARHNQRGEPQLQMRLQVHSCKVEMAMPTVQAVVADCMVEVAVKVLIQTLTDKQAAAGRPGFQAI